MKIVDQVVSTLGGLLAPKKNVRRRKTRTRKLKSYGFRKLSRTKRRITRRKRR
jgi:hypothetical protein